MRKMIGKPRAEFVEGYFQLRPDTFDMLYFYTGIAEADIESFEVGQWRCIM